MTSSFPISERTYRSGVGAMILNAQGLVFVGQRIDYDTPAWQMPQGGIEEGEAPEEALMREMEEEVGTTKFTILGRTSDWLTYELPLHLQEKLWGGRYKGQKQLWFALRFMGKDEDINLATSTPEFKDWQWISHTELLEVIVRFKQDPYRAIFKEFLPFLGS